MGILNSLFGKPKVASGGSNIERKSDETQEQWLKQFMAIYEQSTPLIHTVAELSADRQPADLRSLIEARRSFPSLLLSLKEMPAPPQKELRNIKNDLEKTLSMCIKAGEMAIKMSDDIAHGANLASRMHFSSIVGYTSYAATYRASLLERLKKIGRGAA